MKSLSIKTFVSIVIVVSIVYQTIGFYSYYKNSKEGIANLLQGNFQSQVINLKHILESSIQSNNINKIVSKIDNFTASNDMYEEIHILDNKKQLLHSSNRDLLNLYKNRKCIKTSKISVEDIYQADCYYFPIKFYDKLTPHYDYVYIYINTHYIDSLLKEHLITYIALFSLFTILFLALLWFSLKKFINSPLKELKHYAYYSDYPPLRFFLQELESIRYSLKMTFERMKREQKKLYNLSTQDPLSGLYNRLSLMEKINWLIAQEQRSKQGFTLIFLDIDDFKNINDSYGHEFGDLVLKEIAMMLKDSLRTNDIISRFGGDEFVIILPSIIDVTSIVDVLMKVKKNLFKPINYEEFTCNTTSSMGVVIYPKDGESANILLKNADIAMYKAKELGKNNFHFFTNELNEELQEKLHIKAMIQSALKNNYFELFYQPQVDIKSGKIMGCEALIRIIDPVEGIIPPYKFISIAEQTNLIVPMGQWILKEAVLQLKRWKDTPLEDLKLSINLSALELNNKDFIPFFEQNLEGINRKKLCVELTESVLMNNFEENIHKIHELKALGISLSLDDFGTGYSSLSYLKNIPFDFLKIDKSFTDDILLDPKNKLFIKVIIKISQTMNLRVIVEGVELEEQLTMLEKLGCDIYQGYLCSKPVKVKEFEKLFNTKSCSSF